MIRFACPKCQAVYEVVPDQAGKNFDCRCSAKIKVPNPPVAQVVKGQPDISGKKPSGLREMASALAFFAGVFFLAMGIVITLSNWSSSPIDSHHIELSVYRMNDRVVSVIVGVGWTLGSILYLGFLVLLRSK